MRAMAQEQPMRMYNRRYVERHETVLTAYCVLLFLVCSGWIGTVQGFVIRPSKQHLHDLKLFCQLLGMNCMAPTDFVFSFLGFAKRGGETDIHGDGWGLAFYQGRGLRAFHDVDAACDSPIASFLTQYPIRTLNMMAHIRYATRGHVSLANVHPFQREMWGIQWCFAHNGDVPLFQQGKAPKMIGGVHGEPFYHPIGDTDSEALFCALLNALRTKFKALPSLPVLHDTLTGLCGEIVDHDPEATILNFLLACGPHVLLAYSWPGARPGSSVWNGLHYTVREPPFGEVHLSDVDYSLDFSRVTTEDDRVAVIATKPLTTDEEWVELGRGDLILFDQGIPHRSAESCFHAELKGHGLNSTVIPPPTLEEDMRRYRFSRNFFAGADI